MPTLDWIGKQAVVSHHREVPYRLIHCDGALSAWDAGAGNLLVQCDKVGGNPGLLNPFPRKPKGMHWRTFRRLELEDRAASERLERALYARFRRAG